MSSIEHGTQEAYARRKCSCQTCVAGNTARHRVLRKARFERRVLVEGRLVAPVPPERHGLMTTYNNWGCRCEACTKDATAYKVAARRASGVQQTDDTREEDRA